MIVYSKTNSIEELEQILVLQKQNLPQGLSADVKIKEGFVTVKHTLTVLKSMHDVCPHTIAKSNGKVIGYALSMTKEFANDIPVLQSMFQEISKTDIDKNYITMGQICVDKAFRKKGVFKGLYSYMKNTICLDNYSAIITEIDILNTRSLKAHESLGFVTLKDFANGDKNWRIVILNV